MTKAKTEQSPARTLRYSIHGQSRRIRPTAANCVRTRAILASAAMAAALCSIASAQTPSASILTIEMENVVQYAEGFANPQKNGTSAAMEPPNATPATFFPATFIADIVAINGKKVKGTTVGRNYWVGLNANPSGSQAIADVNRFHAMDIHFDILQADGSAIGTIVLSGVTAGGPPVGAPKAGITGSFAVTGGTGAFLGARGQAATIMQTPRTTSTLENPINRRTYPGGLWKMVIQLIPAMTPEVVVGTAGPLVVHSSDYSLVTAAKPAQPGEILTLLASGLGPTRPGVEPGQIFAASPAQIAILPIDVLVNGKAGETLYAGGYPGTADDYQVNFRIPDDIASGLATIQLSTAWVTGPAVKIPVQ